MLKDSSESEISEKGNSGKGYLKNDNSEQGKS